MSIADSYQARLTEILPSPFIHTPAPTSKSTGASAGE